MSCRRDGAATIGHGMAPSCDPGLRLPGTGPPGLPDGFQFLRQGYRVPIAGYPGSLLLGSWLRGASAG